MDYDIVGKMSDPGAFIALWFFVWTACMLMVAAPRFYDTKWGTFLRRLFCWIFAGMTVGLVVSILAVTVLQ